MKIRRAGMSGVAAMGVACALLSWSETAHAQVKLQYKYPEGKKLSYKRSDKARQVLTLMGMEIESEDRNTVVESLTIGQRRGDSSLPIQKKVESFHVEMSLPGGNNVTFDSKNPDAKIENPTLAFMGDIFRFVSRVTFTLVLDDKNKVKAIEGAEKLMEKADKLGPEIRDVIRGRFEPEKLKREFEQEHQILPDVLARVGEPWERTEIHVRDAQTFIFRKKYEYVGTEKKGNKTLDKISGKVVEVKCTQDPDSKFPLKVIKSDLKVDASDETIFFDREEGCVVSARSKIRIKGDMTYSAGGMDLPSGLDLTIESNAELQPPVK
jgi:Family of unknown function (DUF6263)